MHRLCFYEFPHPTSHFIQTILPLLKHSLSLTLRHFFPLAANIVCPLPPGRPYIRYKDGDSVALTVVESPADFHHVIADYPRDVKVLHPLVPPMPNATPAEEDGTTTRVLTPLAFQVTVFPNVGLCIGSNYCHVIGDGKTFSHFMRHWTDVYTAASSGGACLEKSSLPLLDRDVIKDPVEADSVVLKIYHDWISSSGENHVPAGVGLASNNVRATFVLGRADISRLKQLVTSQWMNEAGSEPPEQFHVSSFVVTCAFIWASLIKSKESLIKSLSHDDDDDDDDDALYYFLFPFDCRNRLEFPVPETYFGNCINPGIVEMKRKDLIGENGVAMAAKAIGRKVQEMGKSGLIGAEKWIPNLLERLKTGRLISVAGSPKLRVYDTEFGWGRPRKVMVHVESGWSIHLTECRDEEGGGIEVSLGMSVNQMNQFVSIFEKSLNLI